MTLITYVIVSYCIMPTHSSRKKFRFITNINLNEKNLLVIKLSLKIYFLRSNTI
jgi:hypothetical protein